MEKENQKNKTENKTVPLGISINVPKGYRVKIVYTLPVFDNKFKISEIDKIAQIELEKVEDFELQEPETN